MKIHTKPLRDTKDGPFFWCNAEAAQRLSGHPNQATAFPVYIALCVVASRRKSPEVMATQSEIEKITGLSSRTIRRRLRDLEELGLVQTLQAPDHTLKEANIYRLLAVFPERTQDTQNTDCPVSMTIRSTKDGPFAWFDKRALTTIREKCEESATAIAVYMALCNIASDRRQETFQVSQAKIADMTKLSRRTVWARLRDLEMAGVIQSIRTPNGNLRETCLYRLLSMGNRADKIRRSIEYRKQLQDQRWKDLARRKREQSGFQCEACGDSSEQLHVHHIHYHKGRMAWEYDLSELKCLCRTCHILTHAPKHKINLFKNKKEDE